MSESADVRDLGVIFDLDGVLVDSEVLRLDVYRELLAEYGATLSVEEYEREWLAAGRGPEYAVAKWGLPLTADELRERRAPRVRARLEADLVPMPGARSCLARLSRHYRLALATNSVEVEVALALERLGPAAPFDAVVGREAYARPKPAPDAFLEAARRLGLAPGSCLVVEDSERGLRGARAAGMRALALRHALNRSSRLEGAIRVLATLDELTPDLVAELLGGASC